METIKQSKKKQINSDLDQTIIMKRLNKQNIEKTQVYKLPTKRDMEIATELKKYIFTSWHWLFISITISLILCASSFFAIHKYVNIKRKQVLKGKQQILQSLKMIDPRVIARTEQDIVKLKKDLQDLNNNIKRNEMGELLDSKAGAFNVVTDIKIELSKNNIKTKSISEKIIEPEPLHKPQNSNTPKRKTVQIAPFKTVEYSFELYGKYKNIFMFLIKESRKRKTYNIKDIKIINKALGEVSLEFILQVNYKK